MLMSDGATVIPQEMAVRLNQAASSVLEMMCSAPVLRDEEFPPPQSVDPMLVGLTFNGEINGLFALAVEPRVATALTGSFLGTEDEPERAQVIEVISELANMLCGSFLGQLNHTESFALSSPSELERGEVARHNHPDFGASYQRTVHLSSGAVSMSVVIAHGS